MNSKEIFNKIVLVRKELEKLFEYARDEDLIYDGEYDDICLYNLDKCLNEMKNNMDEDDGCTDAERYGYDEDTCRANVDECGGL